MELTKSLEAYLKDSKALSPTYDNRNINLSPTYLSAGLERSKETIKPSTNSGVMRVQNNILDSEKRSSSLERGTLGKKIIQVSLVGYKKR